MQGKRAFYRYLMDDRGLSSDAAIESMARMFDRRSPREVAELRRQVGAPPPGASESPTERTNP